jgi:hypothetical protein
MMILIGTKTESKRSKKKTLVSMGAIARNVSERAELRQIRVIFESILSNKSKFPMFSRHSNRDQDFCWMTSDEGDSGIGTWR